MPQNNYKTIDVLNSILPHWNIGSKTIGHADISIAINTYSDLQDVGVIHKSSFDVVDFMIYKGFLDCIQPDIYQLSKRGLKLIEFSSYEKFNIWEKRRERRKEQMEIFEYWTKKLWAVPIVISVLSFFASIFIPFYMHSADIVDKKQMKQQILELEKKLQETNSNVLHLRDSLYNKVASVRPIP